MLITVLILAALVLLLAVAEAFTLIDDLTARRDATTEDLHRQYVAALRAHGIRGVR